MKRAFAVFAVLGICGLAWAGTRVVDTDGSPPVDNTTMLGTYSAIACRGSVRFTDGGSAGGGMLVPYYYDPTLPNVAPWQGANAEACTLDSDTQLDGGARPVQSCSWTLTLQSGYVSIAAKNLVGYDGGAVSAIVRTECFSPQW